LQPTKIEKTAKALGLTAPTTLLAGRRVDRMSGDCCNAAMPAFGTSRSFISIKRLDPSDGRPPLNFHT
jgi:hypothetical protein